MCAAYEKLHGVSFGEPEAGLGNARTAALANGGMIGVRAPMHETETPVVRPYVLVDDVDAAAASGRGSRRRDRAPADGDPGPRQVRHLHPGRHPPRPLAGLSVAIAVFYPHLRWARPNGMMTDWLRNNGDQKNVGKPKP